MKEDNYEYEGWMNSDRFLKRMVSSFFYSTSGALIVSILIGIGFYIWRDIKLNGG